MRIDHLAFRVKDRNNTANFFINAFGYKKQTEFEINFDDNSKAQCVVLEPPEKLSTIEMSFIMPVFFPNTNDVIDYHLAPEIFVSSGDEESIVGKWVKTRNNIGGLHHIAYQVNSVEETMNHWKSMGFAEFSTEDVIKCPGLVQIFTKPSELTGLIYEFIQRDKHGFCASSVKQLMEATKHN